MKNKNEENDKLALRISLVAVLTAVVVLFTLIVRIPTSRGYLNLCDVAIFFTAFIFSPGISFIVAGLGTALADIISGYAQWALISFLVHGFEGFMVAFIVLKSKKITNKIIVGVFAGIAGIIIVSGGYFLGGGVLVNFQVALVEVPMNIIQSAVGAIFGFIVSQAVRKAYPPIEELVF